jgi:predicted PurR-regulated permease PerM
VDWRTLARTLIRRPARRPRTVGNAAPEPAIASTRKQVAFGLIAFAVVVLVVFLVRDLMGAFVLGGLIAFIVEPLVSRLDGIGVPRPLATVGTLVVGVVLVAGLVTLVMPLFVEEVPLLQAQAPAVVAAAQAQLGYVQGHPLTPFGYRVDLSAMAAQLVQNVGSLVLGQFGTAIGIGIAALGTIAQVGLMLLIAFLASIDGPRIGRLVRSLAPTSYRDDVDAILDGIVRMLRGYIRGQLTVAALIGVISGVAVWAIGLKYALALGVLAGVTALIPYLGPFLGAVPAVVVALSLGWQQAILVVVVYVVISNLVLNVLYPKIVGDAVRLPALAVIISFIAGFSLGGILGMFVAVPIAATIRIIYDHVQPKLFGAGRPAVATEPPAPARTAGTLPAVAAGAEPANDGPAS